MRRGKEILEFLRSMPGGASTGKIAEGLRLHPTCAGKIIRELELVGEVFRCNGKWMNTEAALEFNPNRAAADVAREAAYIRSRNRTYGCGAAQTKVTKSHRLEEFSKRRAVGRAIRNSAHKSEIMRIPQE
jgi:hypothetical protein